MPAAPFAAAVGSDASPSNSPTRRLSSTTPTPLTTPLRLTATSGANGSALAERSAGSAAIAALLMEPTSARTPFRSAPPFYWVQAIETLEEFEVSGAAGEIVTKVGDFKEERGSPPIAGTLRLAKGGLYNWTLQVVRECPHRPHLQFGIHGAGHAKPWRLVSTARCSRSRDDGPWVARPAGDLAIGAGDFIHCEADLRGLSGPLGSFAFAVNGSPFETVFEDIPLSDGVLLQPVVAMGGDGTTCRVCEVF